MNNYRICILWLIFFSVAELSAQQQIKTTGWTKLIPSEGISSKVVVQNANNNIDAIKYKDKYYVAFRTAPTHFASKKTKLYIISSSDRETWDYETEFYMESDMREPRFLTYHDTLFFYYFEGGTKLTRFEPKHIWMSKSIGDKKWSQVKSLNMDGFVPWRFRVRNDTIYLSAYYGVNLYKNKHESALSLFKSTDGLHYTPISTAAQISTKGAEEGEFEFDAAGNLWATVRLEGSGAYIVHAHRDSLEAWRCRFSRYKYDSALMLNHKDTMYVFARRHLKGYSTKNEVPSKKERRKNLLHYSLTQKKTAMYRLNKETLTLEHLMDFPSTGDNAFPAIAKISDNAYFLLNYTNDFTKKERNWISGQFHPTYIYWTILTIE